MIQIYVGVVNDEEVTTYLDVLPEQALLFSVERAANKLLKEGKISLRNEAAVFLSEKAYEILIKYIDKEKNKLFYTYNYEINHTLPNVTIEVKG